MNRFILLLVAALLLSARVFAAAFEYADPIDPRASLTIETAPPSISIGDVTQAAEICATDFVCVQSKAMTFAVPRKIDEATRRWTYAGHSYAIASRSNLAVLGVEDAGALRIESIDGNRHFTFLYSPDRGLIGVSVKSSDGNRLYLSTRKIGFGATGQSH
jgi:hypothetical protein